MDTPRELLQLLRAARIAEYYLMSGTREDRSELAAHQPRTQNANAHACFSPSTFAAIIWPSRVALLTFLSFLLSELTLEGILVR